MSLTAQIIGSIFWASLNVGNTMESLVAASSHFGTRKGPLGTGINFKSGLAYLGIRLSAILSCQSLSLAGNYSRIVPQCLRIRHFTVSLRIATFPPLSSDCERACAPQNVPHQKTAGSAASRYTLTQWIRARVCRSESPHNDCSIQASAAQSSDSVADIP